MGRSAMGTPIITAWLLLSPLLAALSGWGIADIIAGPNVSDLGVPMHRRGGLAAMFGSATYVFVSFGAAWVGATLHPRIPDVLVAIRLVLDLALLTLLLIVLVLAFA